MILYKDHAIYLIHPSGYFQVYDGTTFQTFDDLDDAKALIDNLPPL